MSLKNCHNDGSMKNEWVEYNKFVKMIHNIKIDISFDKDNVIREIRRFTNNEKIIVYENNGNN